MRFFLTHLRESLAALRSSLARHMHEERARRHVTEHFPRVHFDWPIHFQVDDYSAFTVEPDCSFGPYSEIVVIKNSPFSSVAGQLIIESGVRIGMGANIRAAGGVIRIGRNTQIGQHVSFIASNHVIEKDPSKLNAVRWDTSVTGITIGESCWIGAGVTLLPGIIIGDGAVIGAGSIVTKSVGKNQLCYGNPARPSPSANPPSLS